MKVVVRSRQELLRGLPLDGTAALISISSYRTSEEGHRRFVEKVRPFFEHLLFLFFDDVDEFVGDPGSRPFSREQAELVLSFLDAVEGRCDLLVCQCEAGVSRSSAVASFVLLKEELKKGSEGLSKRWLDRLGALAAEVGRHLYPNTLVFRLLVEISGINAPELPFIITPIPRR